jgi:O-antigen biosynthesis protein WbqP
LILTSFVIRFFDLVFASFLLVAVIPLVIPFMFLHRALMGPGGFIFRQRRVGYKERQFIILKLRTMVHDAPQGLSHTVSQVYIPPFGIFLRKFKLDELPQLFNVLIGELSLVGPRPGLCEDEKLILARRARDVFDLMPGITGLSQISNVNMAAPERLARVDQIWGQKRSICKYFYVIWKTVL